VTATIPGRPTVAAGKMSPCEVAAGLAWRPAGNRSSNVHKKNGEASAAPFHVANHSGAFRTSPMLTALFNFEKVFHVGDAMHLAGYLRCLAALRPGIDRAGQHNLALKRFH